LNYAEDEDSDDDTESFDSVSSASSYQSCRDTEMAEGIQPRISMSRENQVAIKHAQAKY